MTSWLKLSMMALVLAAGLSAENYDNGISHGLGVGGTVFRNGGFTYRHHFQSNYGIAGSIGGWFSEYGAKAGSGVGLLYTLAHHQFPQSSLPNSSIRIYLAFYSGFIYEQNRQSEPKAAGYTETTKHILNIGVGPGPGIEYFFTKNLALHFELPWMTFFKIQANPASFSFSSSYPHAGGGFTYYL